MTIPSRSSCATWIETFHGRRVDIVDPNPESILIEDIAHALALTNRFGGHTRKPYSVAEHCVRMSRIVPPELELEALVHDSAEFAVGDMPSPFKQVMPEFRIYEARMEAAIRRALNLPGPKHPEAIKYYDHVMLITEARDLGLSWWNTEKHWAMKGIDRPEPLPERIEPWSWYLAETSFMNAYNRLTHVTL